MSWKLAGGGWKEERKKAERLVAKEDRYSLTHKYNNIDVHTVLINCSYLSIGKSVKIGKSVSLVWKKQKLSSVA